MITWKDFMNLRVFQQLRFKQNAVLGIIHPDRVDEKVLASKLGSRVINVTTATLTVTAKEHAGAGRLIVFNRAAGVTATLPAATGTGDVYNFFVATTLTSNGVIQVANATDIIQGVLGVATDAAGVNVPTGAADDTITMNGSTTGGLIGSFVQIRDVEAGVFAVSGGLVSTGAEATPFSAAV